MSYARSANRAFSAPSPHAGDRQDSPTPPHAETAPPADQAGAISTDDLRKLLDTATPGPWNWELNRRHKQVELSGGRQTSAGGDLTVMSFTRWGLQGAAPMFWTWRGFTADDPQRADELAVAAPGRDHHAGWFARIQHPSARLIALAPQLGAEVLALRAEVLALRDLIAKGGAA